MNLSIPILSIIESESLLSYLMETKSDHRCQMQLSFKINHFPIAHAPAHSEQQLDSSNRRHSIRYFQHSKQAKHYKLNIISDNIANNKSKVLSPFEKPFKFSFEL